MTLGTNESNKGLHQATDFGKKATDEKNFTKKNCPWIWTPLVHTKWQWTSITHIQKTVLQNWIALDILTAVY